MPHLGGLKQVITEIDVKDIDNHIRNSPERDFVLKVSGLEIYNETVMDLLNRDSGPLRLLDDPEKGTIVEKLVEEVIKDSDHLKSLINICEVLPVSSLFPYLYFLVRDFNIAKKEEDIGYYAGCVGSIYMFGRALTSLLWGALADRYGRKPVILTCCTTVIICNTLFGLSTNFWMAVCMRFLLGCFSGIFGPVQGVLKIKQQQRTSANSKKEMYELLEKKERRGIYCSHEDMYWVSRNPQAKLIGYVCTMLESLLV